MPLRDMAEFIPAVRTMNHVVFFQRQGTRFLTPGNTGSTPVHDTCRLRLLMDSGSESTKLRMVVRVHPESRNALLARDLGSHEFPQGGPSPQGDFRSLLRGGPKSIGPARVSKTRQRGSIPRQPASTASSSPGGGIGLIRRTCRVRFPGLLPNGDMASSSPGGDGSSTHCRRRVRFPGSLPHVPLAQRQVQSPDKRPTKVRLLHGTRSQSTWCAWCSGQHASL